MLRERFVEQPAVVGRADGVPAGEVPAITALTERLPLA